MFILSMKLWKPSGRGYIPAWCFSSIPRVISDFWPEDSARETEVNDGQKYIGSSSFFHSCNLPQNSVCLCIVHGCGMRGTNVPQGAWRAQRMMRILEIPLKFSGLAASTFTHGAFSLAPQLYSFLHSSVQIVMNQRQLSVEHVTLLLRGKKMNPSQCEKGYSTQNCTARSGFLRMSHSFWAHFLLVQPTPSSLSTLFS